MPSQWYDLTQITPLPVAVWDRLVAAGMAKRVREGNELTGGDPVYVVTDAGRAHALDGITFKRVWGYGKPVNP